MYSQPQIDNNLQIESFLSSLDLPSVIDEQNEDFVAEITIEELYSAISKLKANKYPGTGGFTAEWYRSL